MDIIKSSLWLPTGQTLIVDLPYNFQITPNFQVWEFANKEATEAQTVNGIRFWTEDRYSWQMINITQLWRNRWGWTDITSGCRTQAFNDSLPNATHDSQHCHMKAVDVARKSIITIDQAIAWHRDTCRILGLIGAIGLYNDIFHLEICSDKRYGATEFEVRDFR